LRAADDPIRLLEDAHDMSPFDDLERRADAGDIVAYGSRRVRP